GRLAELAEGVAPEAVPGDQAAQVVVEPGVLRVGLQLLDRVEDRLVVRDPRVEEVLVEVAPARGERSNQDRREGGRDRPSNLRHSCPFGGAGRPTSFTLPSWVVISKTSRELPVRLLISSACFLTISSNLSSFSRETSSPAACLA